MDNPQIWSVSDVNRAVREIVEGALLPFWMSGEIGSLTQIGRASCRERV